MKLSDMLKGPTGAIEVNRVLGTVGAGVYIVGANMFEAVDVWVKGHPFDVIAYCAAFPAGLGVVIGATAGAVALKDRQVAVARSINAATDATTASAS